jgi:co-chaperonin GroES (HSP10)
MKHSYEPNKIKSLKPLRDAVIVKDMNFQERTTSSGIVLVSDDAKNSGIRPRWAEVYAIGPDQRDVKIGQWILIEHGRWTRGIQIQDDTGIHTVRRVDVKDIMLVSDTPVIDDTLSDKVI